jgi:hypothetical protein
MTEQLLAPIATALSQQPHHRSSVSGIPGTTDGRVFVSPLRCLRCSTPPCSSLLALTASHLRFEKLCVSLPRPRIPSAITPLCVPDTGSVAHLCCRSPVLSLTCAVARCAVVQPCRAEPAARRWCVLARALAAARHPDRYGPRTRRARRSRTDTAAAAAAVPVALAQG